MLLYNGNSVVHSTSLPVPMGNSQRNWTLFCFCVLSNWTFVNKKFTIEGWLSTIRFISSSSSGEEGSESDWPWSVQVMYWTEPLWIKKKYSLWPYWHSMGPVLSANTWSSIFSLRVDLVAPIEGRTTYCTLRDRECSCWRQSKIEL